MKMKIDFHWHETIHPSGDYMQIVELARILEEEYDIVANFIKDAENKIENKIVKMIKSGRTVRMSQINEELRQLWREYGRAGKFGKSKIANEEGRPPFVDTSTYMLDMYPMCKFIDDVGPLPIVDDTKGLTI